MYFYSHACFSIADTKQDGSDWDDTTTTMVDEPLELPLKDNFVYEEVFKPVIGADSFLAYRHSVY